MSNNDPNRFSEKGDEDDKGISFFTAIKNEQSLGKGEEKAPVVVDMLYHHTFTMRGRQRRGRAAARAEAAASKVENNNTRKQIHR